MTAPSVRNRWYQSLASKVILFLTLALLPIGLIAIFQTAKINEGARQNASLSFLALTDDAIAAEREVVQRAFGAIPALIALIEPIEDDPLACRAQLRKLLDISDRYSYAGRQSADGVVRCSSADKVLDFSDSPQFLELARNPRRIVTVRKNGQASGQAVMIVAEPILKSGVFDGYASVSVPINSFPGSNSAPGNPVELILFSPSGEVLTSRGDIETATSLLPANSDLADLAGLGRHALREPSADGVQRTFAVVPLVPGAAYALSVWDEANAAGQVADPTVPAYGVPLLMWLASIVAAVTAMHFLVLRNMRNLSREITSFTRDHQPLRPRMPASAASEFRALEGDLVAMTASILSHEKHLEASVKEKNVLLKELHHRVKNNLQLISSIMNMQRRTANKPETRRVLQSLQSRVLGLAAVHRSLYQTSDLSSTNAGALVRNMADQLSGKDAGNVTLDVDVADLQVFPDQAIPLSLLVAEAITNAQKYGGAAKGAVPWIKVHLTEQPDGQILAEVTNSLAPDHTMGEQGLGTQLIDAFAGQLNADLTHERQGEDFVMRAVFSRSETVPRQGDY